METAAAPAAGRSNASAAWRRFRRSSSGVFGLALVVLLTLVAVLAPVLAPYDPHTTSRAAFAPPLSTGHVLGTDNLGRDVLSQVIWGSRVSLMVGLAAAATATLIGVLVGALAGYLGGWFDELLMRITEFFQVIPRFVLALIVVAFFGSGLVNLILVIGVLSWPQTARLVRSQYLSHKTLPYVDAGRALGMRKFRIMFMQILPNAMGPVLVVASLDVAQAILLEASLGFFGLGDPNLTSWGGMLNTAQTFIRRAWWMSVFPGIGITLAVLGFNLFGDGLTEAYDPRMAPR
ncbi:MAG: ABC transporter permease [Trueperaceae bacterium]|nr:ABC transporter permease [Trueperaceae bacterium]MCW5819022.1 ABC transporter permease [Trueperaceae bacterium]